MGAIPATLIVEFYQRVDWTWLSESVGSVNIAAAGGTAQVTVFTAAPGGGTSGAVAFTITAVNQGAGRTIYVEVWT